MNADCSSSTALGKEFSLRRRRTRDEAVDGPAARRAYSDDEEEGGVAAADSAAVDHSDDAGLLHRAAGYLASCFSAGSGKGTVGEDSTASAWDGFPDFNELGDDPDELFHGCDRRASAEAVGEELGLGQDLVKAQERLPPPLRRVRLDLWDARERADAALTAGANSESLAPCSPGRGQSAPAGAGIVASATGTNAVVAGQRDSAQPSAHLPKRVTPVIVPGSPRRRARYVLHVLVLRAFGLLDVQLIGPQDPYVRAAILRRAVEAESGGSACITAEAEQEAEQEAAGTVTLDGMKAGRAGLARDCSKAQNETVKMDSMDGAAGNAKQVVSPGAQRAPDYPEQEQWERTAYIVGGGTAPRWDDSTVDAGQEHKSHLLFPVDRFLVNCGAGTRPKLAPQTILRLEVWNANLVTDERIGAAEVSLPPLSVEHSHDAAARQHHVALDTGGELLCQLYFSRNYYFHDEGQDEHCMQSQRYSVPA